MMKNLTASESAGCVFNIQRYSVHDGPGIRTIVFLKGCPLRCQWCSNPESQEQYLELAYNRSKCIGCQACSRCKAICPERAISEAGDGQIEINRDGCIRCFRCAEACPSKALHVFGKTATVAEVLKEVEADSSFYSRSGGGLTLSGGEPLLQIDFTESILIEAKRRFIHATLETCGFADWNCLKRAASHIKTILYDIKCMDPDKHRQFTGVSNELILLNFIRLRKEFPDISILVRTPVIPGFNDTEADIGAILDFIRNMPNVQYELLPYHRLGQQKYGFLDREYLLADLRLDDKKVEDLRQFVKARR